MDSWFRGLLSLDERSTALDSHYETFLLQGRKSLPDCPPGQPVLLHEVGLTRHPGADRQLAGSYLIPEEVRQLPP